MERRGLNQRGEWSLCITSFVTPVWPQLLLPTGTNELGELSGGDEVTSAAGQSEKKWGLTTPGREALST